MRTRPSQESVRALARRYGVSPTTVQKWRKRQTVTDERMGPKQPRSTVLSLEEEAVIVAFRRHTLLPLDDCLYALQPTIPHGHPCTAVCSATALLGCPTPMGTSRNGPASRLTRPATSTSTSPRCTPKRAVFTCSWPSTAPASSPLLNYTRKPRAASPATSFDT